MRRSGFTLIELLIVVAIIAILAAIAVPNFLEAQTRSKVSRVKADMRSLDTAAEAYVVDYNKPPLLSTGSNRGGVYLLRRLSTPVAYMSTVYVEDPFVPPRPEDQWQEIGEPGETTKTLNYVNISAKRKAENNPPSTTQYVFVSYGPDAKRGPMPGGTTSLGGGEGLGMYAGYGGTPGDPYLYSPERQSFYDRALYDPTNGTVSGGDILRYEGRSSK